MSKELILSLSDLREVLSKEGRTILLSILFFSLFCFAWRLQSTPVYTAKGIVKEGKLERGDSLTLPREILLLSEKNAGDDPLEIITSPPVMERVIKRLNLQGVISSHEQRIGRLGRMGRALKMGWAHYYFRHIGRPPSPFIPNENVIPDRLLFKDSHPPLTCQNITYHEKIYTPLTIKVINESQYSVLDYSKRLIGTGTFGTPFLFEKGSFTLVKESTFSLKKRSYNLTLLPLDPLTEGLKQRLVVKRDRSSSSLLALSHTNSDRELSARLINTTMEEYKNYLKSDSETKATSQLDYLKKRKNESTGELDKIIEEQKHFFLENLEDGGFVTSDREMEFLFTSQALLKKELQMHAREMMRIDQFLHDGCERTLDEILLEVKMEELSLSEEFEKLDLLSAQGLYQTYIQSLSKLHLKREKYDALLEKIDPKSLSSLSVSIDDPHLNELFQKAQRLTQNLQDEKNYTSKERERMKEEVETLSSFLKEHLLNQKNVLLIEENLLQEKIDLLSKFTLKKHFEEYERLNNALQMLASKTGSFPDKWISEQKIRYNTSLTTDIVSTVAKLIESKNIAYHLEYVNSGPFVYAYPPPLPNNPRILFYTFMGGLIGAFCSISFFSLKVLLKGPRASLSNLLWAGCRVEVITSSKNGTLPFKEPIAFHEVASFFSKNQHKNILLFSQLQTDVFSHLLDLLAEQKGNILHIDFTEQPPDENGLALLAFLRGKTPLPPLKKEGGSPLTSIKIGSPLFGFLESKEMRELIDNLKEEYDSLFFQAAGEPKSYEFLLSIATGVAYLVKEENLSDLEPFLEQENKTIFLIEEFPPLPPAKGKLTLKNLEPLLTLLNHNLKRAIKTLKSSEK